MSAPDLLRDLLHPIDPEDFVAQTWGRRSIHVAGRRDKHAALSFGVDEFWRAARAAEEHVETPLMAIFSDEDGWARTMRVSARSAPDLFSAGFSVVLDDADRWHSPLQALCVEIKLALSYAGTVACNAYLSPDGGGAPIHFDNQSIFSLQVSGKKTWRFGRTPAIESPDLGWVHVAGPLARETRPWADGLSPPDEASLEVATLETGDLLYMPPGTWHRPRAVGHSLGVTLTFAPHTASRMMELVQSKLEEQTQWRQTFPPALARPGEVGVPGHLRAVLAARLDQLKAAVQSMTIEDVIHQWAVDAHSVDESAPEPSAGAPLLPESRLRRSDGPSRCVPLRRDGEGAKLFVFYRGEALELDGAFEPLVSEVLRRPQLTASDAVGWLPAERRDWQHASRVLTALIELGALSIAPGAG